VVIPTAHTMRAWAFDGDGLVEAAGVTSLTTRIVGTVAADASDPFGPPLATEIVGRELRTGRELWRWAAPAGGARLVAAQPDVFHVITPQRQLITIAASSGRTQSSFSLLTHGDEPPWSIGHVYASDGFVAVERLDEVADPIADNDAYYFSDQPVLLVAT
jgi:hypothetical protein